MHTLNQLIDPSVMTVSQVISEYNYSRFYVDETFQRRLVWTEKQKIRLIETIMMGYPIPEIYLHQQVPDEENDGIIRHSIVDGQQRIKCISQFMANEFSIKRRYLDEENKNEDYTDQYWGSLPTIYKNKIRQYTFNARTIPSSITTDEIRKIFKRLNETDRSLNPQEIRHAEFNGQFIKLAEALANLPFWRNYNVFTDDNVRRMRDVEFTTSLLSLLKNGIINDNPRSINELYDLYNDVYEDADKDYTEVNFRLSVISSMMDTNEHIKSFFSKQVHLFTLFDLIPELMAKLDRPDLISRLAEFVRGYESKTDDPIFLKYESGSVQRTRSKLSRENRKSALKKFILPPSVYTDDEPLLV